MARFDPNDYIAVNERIAEFYKNHPNGQINTEIFHLDGPEVKNRMVVVISKVYRGPGSTRSDATGIAKEREGTRGANETAFIENAETSAVGRALANLGMFVSKSVASKEEMEAVAEAKAAHRDILNQIKAAGKVGSTDLQEMIKSRWSDAQENPVEAFKLLNDIQSYEKGLIDLEEVKYPDEG